MITRRKFIAGSAAVAAGSAIAGPVGFSLPGAFNPRSISGLKLWLDASQIVGLNDGDAVGTWSDLSGLSNNLTQGTGSAKPIYKTGILNSRPVVRFDGVDDVLLSAANFGTDNSLSGDLVASVFLVYRKSVAVAGNALGWGDYSGGGATACGIYDDDTAMQWAFAGGNPLAFNSFANNTWGVREMHKAAGAINATGETLLNGTSDLRAGSSADTPNVSGSFEFALGRWANFLTYISGEIAEVLVYQGLTASTNRAAIRGYLNAKWAIY